MARIGHVLDQAFLVLADFATLDAFEAFSAIRLGIYLLIFRKMVLVLHMPH